MKFPYFHPKPDESYQYMRFPLLNGVLLTLATSLLVIGCRTAPKARPFSSIKEVTISAHRGGPLPGYPENAFETLIHTASKVDGIMLEIDVQPTLDSVLILMHDKTLDRTTTLQGLVKDHTLDEIEKGFLLDGDGQQTLFKVPTLEAVFKWLQKENAFLSLDVKDKTIFPQLITLIRKYDLIDKTEVITYTLHNAELVHRYDAQVNLSVSLGSITVLEKLLLTQINCNKVAAFTGLSLKDPQFYEKLRKQGMVVTLGTIGNLDNRAKARGIQLYKDCKQLGVDRIATDNYQAVFQALAEK